MQDALGKAACCDRVMPRMSDLGMLRDPQKRDRGHQSQRHLQTKSCT